MSLNFKPYKTIWFNPKRTFQSFNIDQSNNTTIYYIPFFVLGISFGLSVGNEVSLLIDTNPPWSLKLIIYILSSLIGICFIAFSFGLIVPWVTHLIGKIWNGTASKKEITNVYSLSLIPYILFVPYQCTLLVFRLNPSHESINAGFQFLLWIISIRALIIGISTVQKFSYSISLLNILLAILPFLMMSLIMKA